MAAETWYYYAHQPPALYQGPLDQYFQMEQSKPGLDQNGKPVFYAAEGNSLLDGTYHLSIADIERNTVLIPDISLIQKGDLLVKYDVEREPHIGIVVGLGWEGSDNKPQYGDACESWWDQVYVVSVRKGFQMVNLGVWGQENLYGGFADNPEAY